MKKAVFIIVSFLLVGQIIAAPKDQQSKTYKIEYKYIRNGQVSEGQKFSFLYSDGVAYLSDEQDKIRYYIDFNNKQNVSLIKYNKQLYKKLIPFDSLVKPEFKDDAENILGYNCNYASFSSFSNKIEIWYTNKTKPKGSPYSSYLPDDNSLVMKVLVNGGNGIIADTIFTTDPEKLDFPVEEAIQINAAEFEEMKILSRYKKLMVFDNEQINFDPSIKKGESSDTTTNIVYHFSKGSIIMKKIVLPNDVNNEWGVFAKLSCKSNGDAYDRTGSVFMINPDKSVKNIMSVLRDNISQLPVFTDNSSKKYQGIMATNNYEPPLELMRFFTTFGVNHFNTLREINNYPWDEIAEYKQDISMVMPLENDTLWIGVFIGNYDKGGHIVSLELDFYPSFKEDDSTRRYIKSLFNTVNIMEMSTQNYGRFFNNDTLRLELEIPENLNNPQLIYTTTGHGGWGNGDEFNQTLNEIFIDGESVFSIIPWRTDCATYRMLNPASGNFGNGLSSSDLSRSNWCPGTLTPPYIINLNNITSGKHILELVIDQGPDEGNSFNHWSVSGILVGDLNEK
ncbi:MAG: peptide-N-glycosidase [Marinilabiliales bacterium]|nr:MAG: peptide-N-glycosidase [Marinilabiliales bacterium]